MAVDEGGVLGDLPRESPITRPGAPGVTAGEAATESLRLAVGAAEAGLKIASMVTGELLRRLPRL